MGRVATEAPRRGISLGGVLLLLLLLAGLYLFQSGRLARLASASDGAGQTGAIRVFFTTPTLTYPDTPQQRQSPPLLDALVADIDAARVSVDLAAFDFDLTEMTDALLRARSRGVNVRLVVDSENLDTPEVAAEMGRLERAGVPVRFDRREPFMHDKIVIVDGATVWTGSWNVTANDTYRNNNNMIRIASKRLAADYTREFEQLFGGRFGTAKTSGTPYPQVRVAQARVAAFFSPEDGVAKQVLKRLQNAKHTVRFMAFSYTAADIVDAMIARSRAGVAVSGVVEAQNATGSRAAYGPLRDAGLDVLLDGNCYILHHKVIVIDERTVITGSYNFTASAERDNDENLVIVDDPDLARAFLDEFERVYAQAQAPTRCR
jgi:phosphatidylserine/phosphatidylglycerophosphate/cardiolipin synthase-like enzyme